MPEVTEAVLATAKLRPAEQAALLARAAGQDAANTVPRYLLSDRLHKVDQEVGHGARVGIWQWAVPNGALQLHVRGVCSCMPSRG